MVVRAEPLGGGPPGDPGGVTFPLREGRRSGPPAVTTGDGLLVLRQVVPPGRVPLSGVEFARGARDLEGVVLGSAAG
jgi:hypothetical protein